VEKGRLQELGEFLGELVSQEPCPEIVSITKLNGKIASPQEEEKKR
jgi:hypothetical protein